MASELPLPTEVAEIDSQIQMLELMQQGLDGLTGIRNSLPEAIKVLDGVKTGLKGETISFKDLIKLEEDPSTGGVRLASDTSKFEAYADGKGDVAPDLVKEAIRAQKVLEEIAQPFAKSQSSLLNALDKLSSGLDKGSDAFKAVADAVKNMERAWDLFDRAMEGEISSDELIEAFDKYFSGMIDVFAKLIDKVPGLGGFLTQYAKAIHSIIPDLKTINAATLAKNEAIANIFKTVPVEPSVEADAQTIVEQQSESIAQQIEALKEQRMNLLNEHQAELARLATLEVDQLWNLALKGAEHEAGYTFLRISDIWLDRDSRLNGLRDRLAYLESTDPTSSEIPTISAKINDLSPKAAEAFRIHVGMKDQAVIELDGLIRKNPHILQEADLVELQNRFPQLEPAINDIRAGNPLGASTAPKMTTPVSKETEVDTTVKVAVAAAGISTKTKVGLVATGVALVALGASFFLGGGDSCPPGSALIAAGEGIYAVADDPCPPEEDPLIATGGDTAAEDDSADTSKDEDLIEKGDDGADSGDEDSKNSDEPDAAPVAPKSAIAAGLDMGPAGAGMANFFDVPLATVLVGPRTGDPLFDTIFSIPEVTVSVEYGAADLVGVRRVVIDVPADDHLALLGNTVFECGLDDGEMVVVCPEGKPAIPDEEFVLVFMTLSGPVVGSEEEGQAIYAYVIDSDGLPENDWVAHPSFAWDFYQGTDTWFELFHDFGTGVWEMEVRSIDDSKAISMVDVAVRAVIMGDTVMFIVPASSAPVDAAFRVSSFVHDGAYSPDVSAGDVPGADPTEPLLP